LAAFAALAALCSASPAIATSWTCSPLNASVPLAGGAASHQRLSCTAPSVPTGPTSSQAAGPLVVNIVTANLSAGSGLRLTPATAPSSAPHQLATLDAIAAADGRRLIAGINGGYFYRLDVATFFDGVCIGKTAAVAEEPPSPAAPNAGVADGGIVVKGQLRGSNCDCLGYNLPVWLSINGSDSRIDVTGRASPPPAGLALDSLAAGPNLVSSNASGAFVDIRDGDENFSNVYEWAANTFVGFSPDKATSYFVTTDGYDGCPAKSTTCGANAFSLAYFAKDYLKVGSAMAMDQGVSVTEGRGGRVWGTYAASKTQSRRHRRSPRARSCRAALPCSSKGRESSRPRVEAYARSSAASFSSNFNKRERGLVVASLVSKGIIEASRISLY